jgi:hypothetical protein
MVNKSPECYGAMLLAGLLASSIFISAAFAQTSQEQQPGKTQPTISAPAPGSVFPVGASALSESARTFYKSVWGVEILGVRRVSAGTWLRFSYRVVDAKKAAVLNDKRLNPRLIDEKTGATLMIPTMDMVGPLRPTAPPQNGRSYYMIFENPGGLVRPGNRVNLVVGSFRADGLVVQ